MSLISKKRIEAVNNEHLFQNNNEKSMFEFDLEEGARAGLLSLLDKLKEQRQSMPSDSCGYHNRFITENMIWRLTGVSIPSETTNSSDKEESK